MNHGFPQLKAESLLLLIACAIGSSGCGERNETAETAAPTPSETAPAIDDGTVAVILGEPIHVEERDELKGRIFGSLLNEYAETNQIEPTEDEIQAFLIKVQPPGDSEEAADTEELNREFRQMADQFVRSWKINKSLHAKYGGRVIFQQAGVEPLDAYRDFLKEQEAEGNFKIHHKADEEAFWKYFTDDSMHIFYPEKEGAKLLETPWWLMEAPGKD